MRPRPSVVSVSLILLALIHASWGVRMLARGDMFIALSQLVGAGGLLLAGVAATSRGTFATAMGIAAGATGLRVLLFLGSPGPWLGATVALFAGMALAAWAARRLDAPGRVGITPLLLRGGFGLMAAAYFAFFALGFVFGSATIDRLDILVRIGASIAVAVFLDAPRAELPERKALGPDATMRSS